VAAASECSKQIVCLFLVLADRHSLPVLGYLQIDSYNPSFFNSFTRVSQEHEFDFNIGSGIRRAKHNEGVHHGQRGCLLSRCGRG
jgi:hypothetical protein